MFISFEGVDGSGKSTQVKLLAERLEAEGFQVEVFREPGGTQLSEEVRRLLLDPAQEINPFAEMLLFSAARSQLVEEKIKPGIQAGHVIICDRFFDSTIAYQGAGRELEQMDWLADFQRKVAGGLSPFRTYLVDVTIETAVQRRLARSNGKEDRMEKGGEAFFERVIAGYREIAGNEQDRFVVLDGSQSIDVLHEQIYVDFKNTWEKRLELG